MFPLFPMLEYLNYPFFVNALIALAVIGISSGVLGTYIITRRLVSIAGGITHACFGGLGLGYFIGWNPLFTAGIFAVASGGAVEWFSRRMNVREDSAVAVIWAIGMALGVLFVFLTPGYVPELNSFLFGNILTVGMTDLICAVTYTAVLCVFFAVFYKKIVAVAFDPDFARVSGLPVRAISYIMSVFIAVGIVLTIRLVGIMLLMSVLSLPMMTAETWYRRFGSIMTASSFICVISSAGGLFLSSVIEVPCSALIVLILGGVFFLSKISHAIIPPHFSLKKH